MVHLIIIRVLVVRSPRDDCHVNGQILSNKRPTLLGLLLGTRLLPVVLKGYLRANTQTHVQWCVWQGKIIDRHTRLDFTNLLIRLFVD